MKLTTKGRFAVTALLDVALCGDAAPVSLSAVAERQEISLSYLEQLFGKLRRFGLVSSVRGAGGGYLLARPLSEITVADIITAVDEPMDARQCEGKKDCKGGQVCMTHHLWMELNRKMTQYLASVSLADLVKQQNQRLQAQEGPHEFSMSVRASAGPEDVGLVGVSERA